MKVLLTGGSGFLGSHIAEQLSASGYQVRALVRPTSDTRDLLSLKNVELFDAPLEDPRALQSAMAGITHVIHSAGLVKARSPEDFHRVNAQGTQRLLDAAKTNPELQRFVLVSSLAVAGPSLDGSAIAALSEPSPVTHYGRSKLAAERAALANKDQVPLTIIRPPFIYGPRDRECFAFFKAVKLGVFPYMGTLQRNLSAIYATDCAAACVAALSAQTPSGTVYFVEDGQTQTLGQLIGHIESAMGKRAWLRVPVPKRALEFAAFGSELFGKFSDRAVMLTRDKCNELYAPHWVCDASQTRLDLSWEPKIQFAEGARVTLAWYRRAGWL